MLLFDSSENLSKTTLVNFANKNLVASKSVFHVKGRSRNSCFNLNNTIGEFVVGLGSCSVETMSVCEFIAVKSKSSAFKPSTRLISFPPAPIKPLDPILIPKGCSIIQDVYNSIAPITYKKSICYVWYPQDYEGSRVGCAKNKMRLYMLDSAAGNKAIIDFASKKFPSPGTSIYIDGKNDTLCATINNDNGTFTQVFIDCSRSLYHAVCEFNNIEGE
jgi:hypothetical protein